MAKLIVNGRHYKAPEKLTIGEVCDIEEQVGTNLDATGPRMMASMVWIAMRRKDPSVTWEQVRELDIEEITAEDDEESEAEEAGPPVEAGSESEATPATSGARSSRTSSASGRGKSAT